MRLKRFILLYILLLFSATVFGQMADPVTWSSKVKETATPDLYDVTFTAKIASPWHMYDTGPYKGGPNATAFTFPQTGGVELVGKLKEEARPKRIYDDIFGMEIGYYARSATFTQQVRVTGSAPVKWSPSVEYQVCDDQSCLPPTDFDFTITLPAAKVIPAEKQATDAVSEEPAAVEAQPAPAPQPIVTLPSAEPEETIAEPEESSRGSLWSVIIEAILWGFAALLTPCVFPMVPMTVSFFMKGNENKARGRFMASLYGISIVALYTLPIAVIILITYFAGGETVTADIFNWLATHWIPNVIFFLVFMLFAASFFGAFEIRMPSRLVNKTDSQADKGGFTGVFFMALTLVLVSFSCTGPIVGSVLIKSTQGAIWEPIFTMLAFSVAFALPFTLFAFFPSFLNNLPKSGGWLNSVKVVLGFLELALGLKFLSVADQTYHWGLLDREVYLAIWIVVFTLLGLYLLGKLKFAHDSEVKHLSVTRLLLSIVTFSFVVYMIPGMWGAPLKALSGYLPPMHTQDFVVAQRGDVSVGAGMIGGADGPTAVLLNEGKRPKYSDFLHLEHGLDGFFDYDEAMEYARKVNKPLFVDFTGHGCVNCREMEMKVWSDPRVLKLLRDDYVIVALYADDKTVLPESEWVTTANGKVLKSLGKINSYFVTSKFGVNGQPYYLLLNGEGQKLAPGRGYDLNIDAFVQFLETGVQNYKANKIVGN